MSKYYFTTLKVSKKNRNQQITFKSDDKIATLFDKLNNNKYSVVRVGKGSSKMNHCLFLSSFRGHFSRATKKKITKTLANSYILLPL